jgi:hypothetical protein
MAALLSSATLLSSAAWLPDRADAATACGQLRAVVTALIPRTVALLSLPAQARHRSFSRADVTARQGARPLHVFSVGRFPTDLVSVAVVLDLSREPDQVRAAARSLLRALPPASQVAITTTGNGVGTVARALAPLGRGSIPLPAGRPTTREPLGPAVRMGIGQLAGGPALDRHLALVTATAGVQDPAAVQRARVVGGRRGVVFDAVNLSGRALYGPVATLSRCPSRAASSPRVAGAGVAEAILGARKLVLPPLLGRTRVTVSVHVTKRQHLSTALDRAFVPASVATAPAGSTFGVGPLLGVLAIGTAVIVVILLGAAAARSIPEAVRRGRLRRGRNRADVTALARLGRRPESNSANENLRHVLQQAEGVRIVMPGIDPERSARARLQPRGQPRSGEEPTKEVPAVARGKVEDPAPDPEPEPEATRAFSLRSKVNSRGVGPAAASAPVRPEEIDLGRQVPVAGPTARSLTGSGGSREPASPGAPEPGPTVPVTPTAGPAPPNGLSVRIGPPAEAAAVPGGVPAATRKDPSGRLPRAALLARLVVLAVVLAAVVAKIMAVHLSWPPDPSSLLGAAVSLLVVAWGLFWLRSTTTPPYALTRRRAGEARRQSDQEAIDRAAVSRLREATLAEAGTSDSAWAAFEMSTGVQAPPTMRSAWEADPDEGWLADAVAGQRPGDPSRVGLLTAVGAPFVSTIMPALLLLLLL